jgi:uncharacterized protein (TIGR00369 family)
MSTVTEPAPEQWRATRSKTVSWHEPATLAAAARKLSGRELMQAIADGRLHPPPMAGLVGARLVSVGDGEVVFRCAPDESTYNPLGMVHGGLLCTMLDFAAGAAVHTRLPAGVGFSSVEIKVSYLKALRAGDGEIEIHGRVLRVGSRIAFAEAHARNGDDELVGHATSSLAVLG